MVITPQEKSWGPDYLRFGLGLESDFQGDSAFNLLVQYRRTWLNRLGGEWLTEAQVGQDTHLFSEFFQPLNEAGIWFGSVHGQRGADHARRLRRATTRLPTTWWAARARGSTPGRSSAPRACCASARCGTRSTRASTSATPSCPTSGSSRPGGARRSSSTSATAPGSRVPGTPASPRSTAPRRRSGPPRITSVSKARANYVKSWGPHTMNLFAAGGTDFGSGMPAYESFTLGGPLRLSGFRLNQFAGREYAFGRAMYYNRVLTMPDLLGSGVYVGRLGRGRTHHGPLRRTADAGDSVFGIGVPGGGHLRRAGVPGRRVRQRRELQRLPAARRAMNTRTGLRTGNPPMGGQ